jgi:hypothetical protein
MDGDIARKKLWNDIECEETVNRIHSGEINPFKEINASPARIREAIANFEAEDQELVFCLIDLGGNDGVVDRLNRRDILVEARENLFAFIMKTSDRRDEQECAVDSLRCWFHEHENDKSNLKCDTSVSNERQMESLMLVLCGLERYKKNIMHREHSGRHRWCAHASSSRNPQISERTRK